MSKVYLVYMDNGETYEDYHDDVEYIFKTYLGASLFLLQKGFNPYCHRFMDEPELRFIKSILDWHGDIVEFEAWVVEKVVIE